MVEAGRVYRNARSGGTLAVLTHWDDTDGELLEFERALPPRTGKLSPHVHLDFQQTFTIVEGRTRAELRGEELELGPGDTLEVPEGAAHVDPWNPGPERAVVRNRISPVPAVIRAYVETMVAQAVAGKLNRQDEFPFLQLAVLLDETDGQSFDSRFPVSVQRAFTPALAALGRLLGYRVVGSHQDESSPGVGS
jgi:mannose-6-phosphate isomerase-like protein (cupin superfamily)